MTLLKFNSNHNYIYINIYIYILITKFNNNDKSFNTIKMGKKGNIKQIALST